MLIVTAEHNVMQADVSAAQHALSASVIVANDIPMLHVMEAYQNATCHEVSALRHFRLDTVEDDQSMPTSLQLPHSAGKIVHNTNPVQPVQVCRTPKPGQCKARGHVQTCCSSFAC